MWSHKLVVRTEKLKTEKEYLEAKLKRKLREDLGVPEEDEEEEKGPEEPVSGSAFGISRIAIGKENSNGVPIS